MIKSLARRPAIRRAAAAALTAYLRAALRTTRWSVIGADNIARAETDGAAIFACWHERLALMPQLGRRLARRPGGIDVLISRSNDGQLIADVVQRLGIGVLFGSSSRGGAVGARSLLVRLSAGGLVGLTPDGPRGPRRVAQAGVAQIAALSGAPIFPCAAQTTRRLTLKSWDRMVLPLPFGRGVIVCAAPIRVGRQDWRDATVQIGAALTEAVSVADHAVATQR